MEERRRLSRSKSESSLAERYLERFPRSHSLGDVQYATALEEQLRDEVRNLRRSLDGERHNIASLKWENVGNVRAARAEEIGDSIASQNELVYRLTKERDQEVNQIKENAREYTKEKLRELEERKNEEIRRQREEFSYEKELLINELAARFRDEARNEIGDQFEIAKRELEIDYFRLVSENKKLREDLKFAKESDESKAEEIRRLYKDYSNEFAKLKRDASQDSRRQMAEMRELRKIINELEKKLGLESGTCLKLQMEKESLDEALSRLMLADSWDKRVSKANIRGVGDIDIEAAFASLYPSRLISKSHNSPGKVLQRKVVEMTALIRRLDESNQKLATRNQEMINEIENMKNEREPTQQKAKRLGAKNMELVQTNRRQDSRIIDQQEEILALRSKLTTYDEIFNRKDKEISKLKAKVKVKNEVEDQKEEIDTLQDAVQEQLQIIYELRQQAVEKDRRIDVLRERMQKKQSKRKRKNRGRSSTSPDSLEGDQLEDESFSTTSESVNEMDTIDLEASFDGDDSKRHENDNFNQLFREKMEVERAYALLQQQVGGHLDPERAQLQIDAIQSDLLVAQAKIHDLESQLEDAHQEARKAKYQQFDPQIEEFKMEREKLRNANKVFHDKLIGAESEVLSKTFEIKRLTQDLIDVEEQRDLLEFRIVELEEKMRAKSPDIESWQLTDDDKLNLTQDVEEVEFDAVSIRIALKELEINKVRMFSRKEKDTVQKAITLIKTEQKEIQSLESNEKRLHKRVNDLEGKYNNLKVKMNEKEEELSLMKAEKNKSEERQLISTDEAFEDEEDYLENNNEFFSKIGGDPAETLKQAYQKIAEMEMENNLLRQSMERLENQQRTELSEGDLDALKEKVEELKEIKNHLKKVESRNSELECQLEEIQIQKKAKDIIGDVVYGLPNSIAVEIENLDEEKKLLKAELNELRAHSKEANSRFEATVNLQVKEDRCTQTEGVEDTPWHKYMSPRSERSLSRNDSGHTPRLQTDEGTQTPRIRELEERLDKLTFEEPLTSASTHNQQEIIDFDIMPSTEDKFSTKMSNMSLDSEIFNSSAESLFHFAERILEEATMQAKETIKEEFSMTSFSPKPTLNGYDYDNDNKDSSGDDTLSPSNFDLAKGPGEMLDIFLKHYEKEQYCEGELTRNDDVRSHVIGNNSDDSIKKQIMMQNLDFDPLQIETSSVDENSCTKQTSPPENLGFGGVLRLMSHPELQRAIISSDKSINSDLETNVKQVKKLNGDDGCSQSFTSDDMNALLAYGALLRDEHGISYCISDTATEDTLEKEPTGAVNYDESFAVENNNTTVGSQDDVTIKNIKTVAYGEQNVNTSPDFRKNVLVELEQTEKKTAIKDDVREPRSKSLYDDYAREESSVSFDDGLIFHQDDDYDVDSACRLNRTDDGTYMQASAGHFDRRANKPGSIPSTYGNFLSSLSTRRRQSQFTSTFLLDMPISPRPTRYVRSRSVTPTRKYDRKHLRSRSESEILFEGIRNTKDGSSRSNTLHTSYDSIPLTENHREGNQCTHDHKLKMELPSLRDVIRESYIPRKARPPPPVMPKPVVPKPLQLQTEGPTISRQETQYTQGSRSENECLKREVNMLKEECASLDRQIKSTSPNRPSMTQSY